MACEIGHRVSARCHHFIHQGVGLRDGALGFVDKLRLYCLPASLEIQAAAFGERAQRKLFAPLGAHLQNALGASDAAFFLEYTIIFRAETFAKLLAAALSRQEKTDHGNYYNCYDHRDHDGELALVHAASALKLGLARFSLVLDSLLRNGVRHKFREGV